MGSRGGHYMEEGRWEGHQPCSATFLQWRVSPGARVLPGGPSWGLALPLVTTCLHCPPGPEWPWLLLSSPLMPQQLCLFSSLLKMLFVNKFLWCPHPRVSHLFPARCREMSVCGVPGTVHTCGESQQHLYKAGPTTASCRACAWPSRLRSGT